MGERRQDILPAAYQRRNRVTGQREYALPRGPDAEPHRLAGALADLVKDDLDAEVAENLRHVVCLAHRDAARQDQRVGRIEVCGDP